MVKLLFSHQCCPTAVFLLLLTVLISDLGFQQLTMAISREDGKDSIELLHQGLSVLEEDFDSWLRVLQRWRDTILNYGHRAKLNEYNEQLQRATLRLEPQHKALIERSQLHSGWGGLIRLARLLETAEPRLFSKLKAVGQEAKALRAQQERVKKKEARRIQISAKQTQKLEQKELQLRAKFHALLHELFSDWKCRDYGERAAAFVGKNVKLKSARENALKDLELNVEKCAQWQWASRHFLAYIHFLFIASPPSSSKKQKVKKEVIWRQQLQFDRFDQSLVAAMQKLSNDQVSASLLKSIFIRPFIKNKRQGIFVKTSHQQIKTTQTTNAEQFMEQLVEVWVLAHEHLKFNHDTEPVWSVDLMNQVDAWKLWHQRMEKLPRKSLVAKLLRKPRGETVFLFNGNRYLRYREDFEEIRGEFMREWRYAVFRVDVLTGLTSSIPCANVIKDAEAKFDADMVENKGLLRQWRDFAQLLAKCSTKQKSFFKRRSKEPVPMMGQGQEEQMKQKKQRCQDTVKEVSDKIRQLEREQHKYTFAELSTHLGVKVLKELENFVEKGTKRTIESVDETLRQREISETKNKSKEELFDSDSKHYEASSRDGGRSSSIFTSRSDSEAATERRYTL